MERNESVPRQLFWRIRPWNKPSFIILKVKTLDRSGHVLKHQKSRLCTVYTVQYTVVTFAFIISDLALTAQTKFNLCMPEFCANCS